MAREVIAPQPGVQEEFLRSEADITIFGGAAGSGKSVCLLMEPLKYIKDPLYFGVFVRKTTMQLDQSIWKEAKKLYKKFNGKFNETRKEVTFPSGATLKFTYCEQDAHKDNFQGAEYSGVHIDEATQIKEDHFLYITSRMRSKAKNKSYLKCTCNPDADSWLYDWVKPYLYKTDQPNEDGSIDLDKTAGCPNRALSGKIRYYAIIDEKAVSYWHKEDLLNEYPHLTEDTVNTYNFIAGNIDDNPIMDIMEPKYRTQLDGLKRIDRMRLRYGNWKVRPEASGYFKREWVEIISVLPDDIVSTVRAWDFASALPSEVNPDPDYTACVLMHKTREGYYVIEEAEKGRWRPDGVKKKVLDTAEADGKNVLVGIPEDPGAAGKMVTRMYVSALSSLGCTPKINRTNKSKVLRFTPFSAMAEAGGIKVVKGPWNDAYFNELEGFDGLDKHYHDDLVDCSSDAFAVLATQRTIPKMSIQKFRKVNEFDRNMYK